MYTLSTSRSVLNLESGRRSAAERYILAVESEGDGRGRRENCANDAKGRTVEGEVGGGVEDEVEVEADKNIVVVVFVAFVANVVGFSI